MKHCGISRLVILSQLLQSLPLTYSLALASLVSSSLIANKEPAALNATTRLANNTGLQSLMQVNLKAACSKEFFLTEPLQLRTLQRATQRSFHLPHPRCSFECDIYEP